VTTTRRPFVPNGARRAPAKLKVIVVSIELTTEEFDYGRTIPVASGAWGMGN
jgi:hypothetical protein